MPDVVFVGVVICVMDSGVGATCDHRYMWQVLLMHAPFQCKALDLHTRRKEQSQESVEETGGLMCMVRISDRCTTHPCTHFAESFLIKGTDVAGRSQHILHTMASVLGLSYGVRRGVGIPAVASRAPRREILHLTAKPNIVCSKFKCM